MYRAVEVNLVEWEEYIMVDVSLSSLQRKGKERNMRIFSPTEELQRWHGIQKGRE